MPNQNKVFLSYLILIDNPKKQAILSTQDTERRQTKHKDTTQKIKKDEQHRPTQNIGGEPRLSQRESSSCFL